MCRRRGFVIRWTPHACLKEFPHGSILPLLSVESYMRIILINLNSQKVDLIVKLNFFKSWEANVRNGTSD